MSYSMLRRVCLLFYVQIPAGGTTVNVAACVGVLLLALGSLTANNVQAALVVAASERIVLYRERAANMYSSITYAVVTALVRVALYSSCLIDKSRFAVLQGYPELRGVASLAGGAAICCNSDDPLCLHPVFHGW